jgi:hypothetical protein
LVDKSQSTGSNEWQQYAIIVGLTVAVAALLVVVYVFRRGNSRATVAKPGAPAAAPLFESDEEKIIRLIRDQEMLTVFDIETADACVVATTGRLSASACTTLRQTPEPQRKGAITS